MTEAKARALTRRLMARYAELDAAMAENPSAAQITCKGVGCFGCCYQLALASLPEGIAIASTWLSDPRRRQLVPGLIKKLWEQASHIKAGMPEDLRAGWFREKIPCAFLLSGRCTTYEARPAACRYHAVVTEPAPCSPDVVADVGMINTQVLQAKLLAYAAQLSEYEAMPVYVAPLPVTMIWAFKLLLDGREAFEAALRLPVTTPQHLRAWTVTGFAEP